MRITTILIACFLMMATTLLAQQPRNNKFTVAGKILDSLSSKPVAYATITLLDNNKNIGAFYTLESGTFKYNIDQTGTYKLEISVVGYKDLQIPFTITGEKSEIILPDIHVSAVATTMNEVTVTARKKLIQKKPGMLVYLAENDVTNSGGTAADVLRKAPVINVDAQGNVSMRGNSNIKVLVNGKYSGQMARSVSDALNMMPADIVKAIEVITNPSARYDAEGAAGVINIITKKGSKEFSGTVEVSASNWEQMINPRLSFSKNKWNVTLNGHIHRLASKTITDLDRTSYVNGQVAGSVQQSTVKKNAAPHGSGDIAITYAPDSATEISFGANAWFGKWPDDRTLATTTRNAAGAITDQYKQNVDAYNQYLGSDFNIGYNRKLKRAGQELTMLVQYTPAKDKTWYNALQTDNNEKFLYSEVNNNRNVNQEWTFQADYAQPISANGKYIVESGIKGITRHVTNDYDVAGATQPGNYVIEPSRTDQFKYTQNVWAGYALLKLNFTKGWYVEGGARLENTWLKGSFATNGNAFSNNFNNFIPTATVSWKASEAFSYSASYTRRITRPYIWDLNPNANSADPKNIESGNPGLQPEITHQTELSWSWSPTAAFFLNSAFYWKKTEDAMIRYTQVDGNGIAYTSKQNLAGNQTSGLNLSAAIRITQQFNINTNVNANYLRYTSDALQIYNDGWAGDINFNATHKLPRNYTLQGFVEYDTRLITLQGYKTNRYYYSFAAKKELSDPKLTITISTVNPFAQALTQSEGLSTADFISTTKRQYYNRAFKLTLNWDFGKSFRQKQTKKINNNDINVQGKG